MFKKANFIGFLKTMPEFNANLSKHQQIIQSILEKESKNPNVIAICIFGSVADGTENPKSDIDIDIVYNKGTKWKLCKQKIDGIKVDCANISKQFIQDRVDKYPYLSWSVWKLKVIYDKDQFMEKIKSELDKYFEQNPEVKEFWEKDYALMKKQKSLGVKPKGFVEVCDEAETRFSKYHSIKRTILTKEFYKKNIIDNSKS